MRTGRPSAIWQRFELALLSYVLLGSHYHALVRIADARLSQALQRLHTGYSRWHNRRHARSAHLFRAHAGLERPRIPLAESDLGAAFGDADNWRERYRAQIETAGDEAAVSDTPDRATRRSGLKENRPAYR